MRWIPCISALLLAALPFASCKKQEDGKEVSGSKQKTAVGGGDEPAGKSAETGAAAASAFDPPLAVTFAKFDYRDRDREVSTTIALALGTARALNGETVTLWLLRFPDSDAGYSSISLKLEPKRIPGQGEPAPESVRVNFLAKIDGTDLRLFTSKEVGVGFLPRGVLGNRTGLSALCLSAGKGDALKANTSNWVAVPVAVSDSTGGEVSLKEAVDRNPAQSILPLVTPAGELAGVAVGDGKDGWKVHEIPEIKAFFEPVLGPFQVSALAKGGGHLELQFNGVYNLGVANEGQFVIAIGQEKEARQGFDKEGRRFLVDLDNPEHSTLPTTPLRTGSDGRGSATIEMRLPADAAKAGLVGQLLWVPTKGSAVPYPPFAIDIRLGDIRDLTVTGSDMFQVAGRDQSGKSQGEFLSDAQIVDLQGQMIPNQAACFGSTVVLVMKDKPRVQLYSLESSKLAPLGTSLKGGKLLLGGDGSHIYLFESDSGIIEKWNLATRELVTAGVVEKPGEVLALTAIEASPEGLVVLLCKDRFRFLSSESLSPRMPKVVVDFRQQAWGFDDFRVIMDDPKDLTDAIADRAAQGFAAIFRVSPPLGARENGYVSLIMTPAADQGAVRVESKGAGVNSLGTYGASFYGVSSGSPRQLAIGPGNEAVLWTGKRPAVRDGPSYGCSFPSPAGLNLLLGVERHEGVIPDEPYEMLVYEQGAAPTEPISLGTFNELVGCAVELRPGVPCLSKHLFFAPEAGKIVSLSADGTKLFDRKLKTAALLNQIMKGGFVLAAGGPTRVWRGQALRYQMGVAGVEKPAFSLMEGPAGATVSGEGLLSWTCPEDLPGTSVGFRIGVKDPATGRSLEKSLEMKVQGPSPSRAIHAAEAGPGMPLPLRIVDVPHAGVILDKIEVDRGRLNVMVTETPDKTFRLEVFNAETEAWLDGVGLPARPDVFTANPKIIYLGFGEQSTMELRSMDDLSKTRRITLPLPLAGIGCGSDTTEGVLCIAERLDPEKTKVGEIIDWDGSRITLSKSSSQHVRLVFLSPTSLKPLPITGRESELAQATFFMPRDKQAKPIRFGFSPSGLLMTMNNYLIDFGEGRGELRTGVHALGNEPIFITERGTSLYSHTLSPRYDRSDKLQEGRILYQKVEQAFERGSTIRPVPGRDLDVGFNPPGGNARTEVVSAVFRRRSDDALVLSVSPLPEIQGLSLIHDQYPLQARMLSVYGTKLLTIGHRKRQLFIRDLKFP